MPLVYKQCIRKLNVIQVRFTSTSQQYNLLTYVDIHSTQIVGGTWTASALGTEKINKTLIKLNFNLLNI